jgi:hypothetical protein
MSFPINGPLPRAIITTLGTKHGTILARLYTDRDTVLRLSTHHLCGSSEGLNNGLELKVIIEEEQVGDGNDDEAKSKDVES